MKVALLSDLHGNDVALKAVLEETKKQGIEQYIITGDMITDFPGTNEVLNTIRQLTPYVIRGNRENYVLQYENTKQELKWKTIQNHSIVYFYETLTKENKEYLRKLPENLSITLEGVTIKVVHGSPFKVAQGIRQEDQALIQKSLKAIQEKILLCGHTHQYPFSIKKEGKILLSCGSVGVSRNTKAQYVVLEIKKGQVTKIEIKEALYSQEELKKEIETSDILQNAYVWTNLIYHDLVEKEPIQIKFVETAIKKMELKHRKEEGSKYLYTKFHEIDDDIYEALTKEYEPYFLLPKIG